MTEPPGDRRAQIVAAASRVLAREGTAAVTTRKIACEAAVNLATVRFLFGSKDAILAAVLAWVTRVPQGLATTLADTAGALWALPDREMPPPTTSEDAGTPVQRGAVRRQRPAPRPSPPVVDPSG